MYINPETRLLEPLIGKVFTVQCREVWDSGGMRGASFLGGVRIKLQKCVTVL